MRNQRAGMPTLASTAWGMAYGALVAASWRRCQRRGVDVRRAGWLRALARLSRGVRQRRGVRRVPHAAEAGRRRPSSYTGVATPVIAMLLSTLFEGYRWTGSALLGVVLAAVGNVLVIAASTADRARRALVERAASPRRSASSSRSRSRLDQRAEPLRRPGDDLGAFGARGARATSGCASTFCTSALSRATISGGVPAGATMPQ